MFMSRWEKYLLRSFHLREEFILLIYKLVEIVVVFLFVNRVEFDFLILVHFSVFL